jgi:hypothetical protein
VLQLSLAGLRDATTLQTTPTDVPVLLPGSVVPLAPGTTAPVSPTAEAAALAAVIDAQNQRIFKLTMISTTVVAISALITAWRTLRQLRRDEAVLAARLARR